MKAVEIRRTGPPEALEAAELPIPRPVRGEVRIRVHRAGVNFADVLARQGIYPDTPKLPFVPGYEVSGVVDLVGPGVEGFSGGERVAAFTRFGGYAEWAVAKAPFVVPLPAEVGFSAGAAVPVNFATAYHCLFHTGALFPGDRVLIHAAAGGVGLSAVQMAKGAGAVVFGTAGSAEKVAFLDAFGVDHPIDYRAVDFVDAVRSLTGGEGVDVILDSIGGQMLARDLQVLRTGGRIVSLGVAAAMGKNKSVMLRELMSTPHLQPIKLLETSRGFFGVNVLRLFDHRPALGTALLRSVFDMVAAGKARPVIAGEIPLERAPDAHRMLEERSTIGKMLLAVRER
ncbi:MAG: quinone oxidoreductase family protein [Deltaproteobacteria bacterium]|nr:zinc-binding dehydrogenase [Candidatus Deferrimicrobiaceae bacterium]